VCKTPTLLDRFRPVWYTGRGCRKRKNHASWKKFQGKARRVRIKHHEENLSCARLGALRAGFCRLGSGIIDGAGAPESATLETKAKRADLSKTMRFQRGLGWSAALHSPRFLPEKRLLCTGGGMGPSQPTYQKRIYFFGSEAGFTSAADFCRSTTLAAGSSKSAGSLSRLAM
jgi:hypothetical protein